jgi:hypothetical protein
VINIIRNSEIQYAGGAVAWLGPNGRMDNNKIGDVNYEGGWGAPAMGWQHSGDIVITRNSFYRCGRSNIDVGNSYAERNPTTHFRPEVFALNWEISYNDCQGWGMVNVDLGAIYSWGFRNTTGGRIHHNWFHHAGVRPDPDGIWKLDGGQRCTYADQASGPFKIYKNVFYINFIGMQDCADVYNQNQFEVGEGGRNAGPSQYWNNTFVSGANHCYTTYENSPHDHMRNNLFIARINKNWGNGNPPDEQHNIFLGDNVTRTQAQGSTSFLGNNSIRNVGSFGFLGTGAGGLAYRLGQTSIARGKAMAIAEIGVPAGGDCGAYQFSENNTAWVPGYVAVPYNG